MARDKQQRIATEAGPASFTNPFASLSLEIGSTGATDLPPVQEPVPRGAPAPAGRLLLRRSTAHRGGKTVLVLEGFSPAWSAADLESLLHELKTSLGCGGKAGDHRLELQGELADRLVPLLESRGFVVKRGW